MTKAKVTNEEIIECNRQGLKDTEIARKFGLKNSTSISQRRKYLKLSSNDMKITDEEITKLNRQGLSDTKIAQLFSMAPNNVSVRRNKLGLLSNGPTKVSKTTIERINELSEHNTCSEIADILNMSIHTIYKIRIRYRMRNKREKVTDTQIKELHSKGLIDIEISELVGIRYEQVHRRRKGLNLLANGHAPFGIKRVAKDGHLCLSSREFEIDNWLTENGIVHEKEVPLLNNSRYIADWKIGEIFIEYCGMAYKDPHFYDAKKRFYESLNFPHLFIYPNEDFKEKLASMVNVIAG